MKNIINDPVSINVENLSIKYDGNFILNNLQLNVVSGSFVALIGDSGSGKTTFIDTLLGLTRIEKGNIEVDKIKIQDTDLSHWRECVGYMSQKVPVITGTIRDNIRFGRENIDDAAIDEALVRSSFRDFISRRPNGLDTGMTSGGNELSGGELQRLGLARALAGRPRLLLLDEVSSALDAENEQNVVSEINRLRGTMTIIVIAHRLSTVRAVDQIYMLNNGRIEERGTWDELMAKSKKFNRLWRIQNGE